MNEALELISINFWHTIAAIGNLLILTWVFKKFLFKPVQKILAERQAEVDTLYEKAEESAASAEKDKQMYHEKMTEAEHEVEEIIRSATVRAEHLSDEIVAEAKAKADAAMKKADADIAQSKKKAINEIKAGKVEYRVDKTAIIHCPIGRKSFEDGKLIENLNVLMDAINKAKPAAAKGTYVRSVVLSSTMGPGIKVNPLKF